MYENSKPVEKCPLCGNEAPAFEHTHYVCKSCDWDSLKDTIDISYSDNVSAPLSNLFPHKFVFYTNEDDETTCLSMESFLQSLRVKDPVLQKQICENYSGYMAYKLRTSLRDWRESGTLYWNGIAINRFSPAYTELITTAYDCLYEGNDVFRELVLPAFKDKILIHSTGCEIQPETLLTETEYLFQLKRLIERFCLSSNK